MELLNEFLQGFFYGIIGGAPLVVVVWRVAVILDHYQRKVKG